MEQESETKTNTYISFWKGPFEIRVPTTVKSVPAPDRINSYYKGGIQTELFSHNPPYTEEEYHKRFCEVRKDGHWWFRLIS